MTELHLHRDDLEKILKFVDKLNPINTMRVDAGIVKINVDSSSGIGSIITATLGYKYDDVNWGDLTIVISGEENW